MHGRIAALALALASCKDKPRGTDFGSTATGSGSSTTPEIVGSLWVDGKAVTTTACRPGRGFGTYVEVVTDTGKLRFEDKSLYWSPDPKDPLRGDRLDCEKLDRSWGGGSRADGTSYWRGTLAFACTAKKFAVSGELTLDCGNITPEERAGLDAQRRDMRAAQAGHANPAAPTKQRCEELLAHVVALEFRAGSGSPAELAQQQAAVIAAKRDEFVASCLKLSPARVECALGARDQAALAACDAP